MFKPKHYVLNKHFPEDTLDKEYFIDALPVRLMPFSIIEQVEIKFSKMEGENVDADSMPAVKEVLNYILPKIVVRWNLEDAIGDDLPVPTEAVPTTWTKLPLQVVTLLMQLLVLNNNELENEEALKENGGVADDGLIPFVKESPSSPPLALQVEEEVEEMQVAPV